MRNGFSNSENQRILEYTDTGILKNNQTPAKRKFVLPSTDQKIKQFGLENLQLVGLFLVTIYAVYYAPTILSKLYIVAIVFIFIVSKKDYFWLGYFFMISFTPLAFFNETSGSAIHRLPLFSLGPGFSFSTEQIFLIAALLKAIYKRKKINYIIQNSFYAILAYFGLLLIAAVFVHHTSFTNIINTLKALLAWSLLYILPVLLRDRNDVYKIIYLLLPFILVIFIGAVYFFLSGGVYIYSIVNPAEDLRAMTQEYADVAGRFIPHGGQFQLVFLGFIFSLLLLNLKKGNSIYLYTIAIVSYLIVIMGAFRSWFVIFTLIFGGFLMTTKDKGKNMLFIAVIGFLLLIFMNQTEKGSMALQGAWERTATIFELGQSGSASTTQMEHKAKNRLPVQLEYISENPLLGWGFTDKKGDPDVGNFALLVEVGILGFLLFCYLWYSYIRMIVVAKANLPKSSNYRIILNILLFGFLGLLLSHFTTNRIFGITSASVLLSMYFFFTDFFVKDSYSNRV